MAITVIGTHTLGHMYVSGYLVLIPAKDVDLEPNPVQAGLKDGVHQPAGGATSMTGGFCGHLAAPPGAGAGASITTTLPQFDQFLTGIAPREAGPQSCHVGGHVAIKRC